MPLAQSFSLVADSTASSSPSKPQTPIKRAPRTYGRSRGAPSTVDSAHLRSSSSSSNSAGNSSVYRTGPTNTQEEIPPSSEPSYSSPGQRHRQGDDDDPTTSPDASSKFTFGWRERLAAMDADDDEDDSGINDKKENSGKTSGDHLDSTALTKSTASSKFQFDRRRDSKETDEDEDMETTETNGGNEELVNSPVTAQEPFSIEQRESGENISSRSPGTPLLHSKEDIFGGSLSTLTASSQQQSDPDLLFNSPPVTKRKRVSRRAVSPKESGSDADEEENPSPAKPFPINSPDRPSSPTPPTSPSEDEMNSRKASRKGKGRASRVEVPPLQFEEEVSDAKGSSLKLARKQRKVKKPTKKERKETDIEMHRMKAERQVRISQPEPKQNRNMSSLLAKILDSKPTPHSSHSLPPPQSSPIQQWSSPTHLDTLTRERPTPGPSTSRLEDNELRSLSDSEDEHPRLDMQPVVDDKKAQLLARKRLALQKQQQQPVPSHVSDDELEIVPMRSPRSLPAHDRKPRFAPSDRKSLIVNRVVPKTKGSQGASNAAELSKSLLQKAMVSGQAIREEKKERWIQMGGSLAADVERPQDMSVLLEQGLERRNQRQEEAEVDEEDEDGSDGEYNPELYRGSASPQPQDEEEDEDAEENLLEDEMPDGTDGQAAAENEEEREHLSQDVPMKTHHSRRKTVVDSDTETEETPPTGPTGRVLVPASSEEVLDNGDIHMTFASAPRRGSSSSGDITEDEYDKENDRGDDKENAAVSFQRTISRSTLGSRRASQSSTAFGDSLLDVETRGNDEDGSQRQPLKPLTPHPTESLLSSPMPFFDRLRQSQTILNSTTTPAGGSPGPSPSLQPALNLVRPKPDAGFSQFSDDESENIPVQAVQGGFSDLFDSVTQNSPTGGLGARKPLSLGLTQDVEGTMLAVDENLNRKADEIFEKEQGWLVERAEKGLDKKPELYINDAGFLTQTRPEGTPDVYRPLPTQTQPIPHQGSSLVPRKTFSDLLITPSQRKPFMELSDVGDETLILEPSSSSTSLHRLKKKRENSPPETPSGPPRLLGAFDPKPLKAKSPRKPKDPRAKNSEFVMGEAEESDEETFGFVRNGNEDEDDENPELDKTLETLVDDKEMDEETMNREAVMEKFQEHADKDDQELLNLHQAAVDGELRRKRKKQVGIDDSDDEEGENYRNSRLRRKMYGASVQREKMKDLEKDPATVAFYNSYANDLEVDMAGLEYLTESQTDTLVATSNEVKMEDAYADAEDEGYDEEEEPVMSRAEIIAQIREKAQENRENSDEETQFDTNDVSYLEEQDMDDEDAAPRVKPILGRKVTARKSTGTDMDVIAESQNSLGGFLNSDNRSKMQSWAQSESRSRAKGGNGRSVAGAAITSHQRKKVVEGGGSLRRGATSSSSNVKESSSSRQVKPLKAAQSFLKSSVMDRSSRFGQ